MIRPFSCAALALAAVALAPRAASADDPRVAAAQKAYDELRYEDVLVAVAAARREGPPLVPADEAELTRLEAYTFAVFDDEAHAVEAFQRLLAIDPAFVPGEVSPKIRSYFERARRGGRPTPLRPPNGVAPPPTPPRPEPPPSRSWLRSPWLWSAVGVVAVVGGAGAYVLYDRRGPPAANGNLGMLDLR